MPPAGLAAAVFAVAVAGSLLAWRAARRTEQQERAADFQFRVRDAAARIEAHMTGYEQALRGAQGLFAASKDVTRDEFRAYVDALAVNVQYPGIQGIGFGQAIRPGERAAHVAAIRAEGFPDYDVRPPGERDPLTAIIYLEPFRDRNLRAFGFDMYSEAVRRAAMTRARDTGRVAVTGKVKLLQETDHDVQAGFLMYLPVYRAGAPISTVEERRGALRGWVYAPFRANDFMAGVLGERAVDLDVEILDAEPGPLGPRMYRSAGHRDGPPLLGLVQVLPVVFGEHRFVLVIRPGETFLAHVGRPWSMAVLAALLLVSALIGVLAYTLARGRQEAEVQAADRERDYSTLFRELPTGVLVYDGRGRVVEVNPAGERILGQPRETLLGWNVDALGARVIDKNGEPIAPGRTVGGRVLAEGRMVEDFEEGIRHPGGEPRWLHVKGVPLAPSGQGALIVFSDVTERRRAEQALQDLNDGLERRVAGEVQRNLEHERTLVHQSRLAAMGEMIGAIAHQWRQPLNTLAMLLENLGDAEQAGELDSAYVKTAVATGTRLVQQMSTTISDFRDFFRPDKEAVRFAVRAQVEGAVGLVDAALRHHRITVVLEGDGDVCSCGLPNEYSQVVLNLLANARDAIVARGRGEGRIVARVDRVEVPGGRACRLVVTDDGGGVAVDPIERIFEPYFTTKPSGTGLGLYMSRMILERSMAGTIAARNVPGGAEFTIITPLAAECS